MKQGKSKKAKGKRKSKRHETDRVFSFCLLPFYFCLFLVVARSAFGEASCLSSRTEGFDSPTGYFLTGWASAQPWLITTASQVRPLNPALVRPSTQTWQSDQVESLVFVGSTPTSVTYRSRGPAATTAGLHPGNDGSSPSGTTGRLRRSGCERFAASGEEHPDGETEIMPRFERDVPGSTPGRGACWSRRSTVGRPPDVGKTVVRFHSGLLTSVEGQADRRRHHVGSVASGIPALRVRLPLLPLVTVGVCVVVVCIRLCESRGGGFNSPYTPLFNPRDVV
jgi:hypothetical protein